MAEGGDTEERIKTTFLSGSDDLYDFYCEFCMDDGKNVEAEGYCNDCSEYLCAACYSGHTKTRQTKHHKMLDKDSMPKNKPLPYDHVCTDITTMCQVHTGKPVEYFCKSHSVLGCGTCILNSHRTCEYFESILEKSENILDSSEYKEIIKNLELLGTHSRDIEEKARACVKEVNACYAKVIESIDSLKKQVIETFERLEKDVKTEAVKLVSEDEQKMTTLSAKCSSISDSVDSLLATFQSLQSSKRVCQIYISMKQNSEEILKLQGDLTENEKSLVVRKFRFEPGLNFQEIVNKANTLGKIIVQDSVNIGRTTDPITQTPEQDADVTDIDHSSKLDPEGVPLTDKEGDAAKQRGVTVKKAIRVLSELSAEDHGKNETFTEPIPQTPTEPANVTNIDHLSPCTMPTPETVSQSKAVQVFSSDKSLYDFDMVQKFCKWLNPGGYKIYVRRAYSEVEREMPLIVLCHYAFGMTKDMKEVFEGHAISLDRVAIIDMHTEGTMAKPLFSLGIYYAKYGRVGMHMRIECKSDGQINDKVPQRLLQFIEFDILEVGTTMF